MQFDIDLIKDSRRYIFQAKDLVGEKYQSKILKDGIFIKQDWQNDMDKSCKIEMSRTRVIVFDSKIFYLLYGFEVVDSGKIYKLDFNPTYLGVVILFFFTFSYFLIFKSLKPLQTLENSIRQFGNGDFDIDIEIFSNDEIGRISKEFSKTVKKLSNLEKSRKLFLRNIIHELKTPITKGKLSIALLEKRRETEILDKVFKRLDALIDEMANIEQLTSNSDELNCNKYSTKEIIEQAIKIGFLNRDLIQITGETYLHSDLPLISIAFKNLIDNGVKYSDDGKIEVVSDVLSIQFISKGKKLQKKFSEYIKPFNHSQISSKTSLGLGLYIVDEVSKKHSFKFNYKYFDGKNIFSLVTTL